MEKWEAKERPVVLGEKGGDVIVYYERDEIPGGVGGAMGMISCPGGDGGPGGPGGKGGYGVRWCKPGGTVCVKGKNGNTGPQGPTGDPGQKGPNGRWQIRMTDIGQQFVLCPQAGPTIE
jgi:hypothetical protein